MEGKTEDGGLWRFAELTTAVELIATIEGRLALVEEQKAKRELAERCALRRGAVRH